MFVNSTFCIWRVWWPCSNVLHETPQCLRIGITPIINCFQSNGREEHLFFRCSFSLDCWNSIGITIPGGSFDNICRRVRSQAPKSCVKEIFISACWHIWKQRNGFIFNRSSPSRRTWFQNFKDELLRQSVRLSPVAKSELLDWLVSVSFVP